jgi:hypothetical protein
LDLITKKVMSFMGLEQEIEESGKWNSFHITPKEK